MFILAEQKKRKTIERNNEEYRLQFEAKLHGAEYNPQVDHESAGTEEPKQYTPEEDAAATAHQMKRIEEMKAAAQARATNV